MNNEIKEILDSLTLISILKKTEGIEEICKELNQDEIKTLLDYITNLQEENAKLKYSLMDRIKQSDMLDEYIERIDKAIEYIVTHRKAVDERDEKIIFWLTNDFDEEDLLNILEGEDK